SRVRKLAAQHPAVFIAFDLLADRGRDLTGEPLADRKAALEGFAAAHLEQTRAVRTSPSTDRLALARQWLAEGRGGLDGVMAKRIDLPYQSGNREGMV